MHSKDSKVSSKKYSKVINEKRTIDERFGQFVFGYEQFRSRRSANESRSQQKELDDPHL